ncbi:protein ILRUN isoform X1 [Prionailurus iriomotensis]
MDVDLDPELMQKFSCLGTTDKDVLISEFQRLLGFQLNPAGCAFFLDMTNCMVWNLQAAIGAYYDFESPNISVPSMSFVEDVTIGEGESIPPDTQFIKTWRIQNSESLEPWSFHSYGRQKKSHTSGKMFSNENNTGIIPHVFHPLALIEKVGTIRWAEAWPPGVCLKYVGGDQFGHVNMVMVRSLEPQEIADVSVQMCSPSRAGMYQGQWRMCTATGLYYGDVIWVILSVEVGGLLGVTQQLSSFETEFNTQPHRKVEGNFNPFASPQKNRQSDENNLKDPGGSEFDSISKNTWAPAPDQTEQDENRLSQNSVNLSPSSHANNLSVVTYSKGLHGPYPFGQS